MEEEARALTLVRARARSPRPCAQEVTAAGLVTTTLVYLLLDLLPTVLIMHQNRRVLGTSRLLVRGRAVAAALRGAAAAAGRTLTCASARYPRSASGRSALDAKPLRALNSGGVSREVSVALLGGGGGGAGRVDMTAVAASAIADAVEPPATPMRGARGGSAGAAAEALFSPSVDAATLFVASSAADDVAGAVSARSGPTASTPFLPKAPPR